MNELNEQFELEQYSRRLCIRINGLPMAENETSKCVLQNVKSIIEETSGKIVDVATNRTHQMVKVYNDKTFGVNCKNIIVWFATFRHRNIFYHNRKNRKCNLKVRLSLAKKHFWFLPKQ